MRFAPPSTALLVSLAIARGASAQAPADPAAPAQPAPPAAPPAAAPSPGTEPPPSAAPSPAAAPPSAAAPPAPADQEPTSYGEPAVYERPGYPAVEPEYTHPTGHGAFTHDGFYLRLGFGLGWALDSLESNPEGFSIPGTGERGALTTTLSSLALATELALGCTPADGLVLGGGVFSNILTGLASSESRFGDVAQPGMTFDNAVFVVFGFFADYYFDPRAGFHVQGALGMGQVLTGAGQLEDGRTVAGGHSATGPGLVVGMGYEWFIAGQWSLGVLLRASGALVTGGDDRKLDWDHTIVAPALLATLTYH